MRNQAVKPLIFQRSGRIILDVRDDAANEAAITLRRFAELVSAAGTLHTYRVTDLSLWAAAAIGLTADEILDVLRNLSDAEIPVELRRIISRFFDSYGAIRIEDIDGTALIVADDPLLLRQIARILDREQTVNGVPIDPKSRGIVKSLLAREGLPVIDLLPIEEGPRDRFQPHPELELRNYQHAAVERFLSHDGGGTILLPCGSGKTVVGVAIAGRLGTLTLVVVPNRTIGEQWLDHFLRMTDLNADQIGLFENVRSDNLVSIVTYQALTGERDGVFPRLIEASEIPWGLVIYDEAHSLPAEVFRRSAALQSRRRLGLTATLVREDGKEREVFALVGPPIWQSRWRELEEQGWISPVECYEVRVRVAASEAPEPNARGLLAKIRTVERILDKHPNDRVLIAAHRLDEIAAIGARLKVPTITGKTPHAERRRLYGEFRTGSLNRLVVSRVANVGVDLPDANVLIQVSGTFGSRLEEAQRLGRLLRPGNMSKPARFYSLVLPNTRERQYAENRQRFLVDQGYEYRIVNARA